MAKKKKIARSTRNNRAASKNQSVKKRVAKKKPAQAKTESRQPKKKPAKRKSQQKSNSPAAPSGIRSVRAKKRGKLTLPDRLSHLTYVSACQLLGPSGKQLIAEGNKFDTIDTERDVHLGGDLFRLRIAALDPQEPDAIVTLTLMASARNRLHYNCTACDEACPHVGAAFSLILEEKSALGLAEPAIEDLPFELLDEGQLMDRAVAERQARADAEKFRLNSSDSSTPWTDYVITSANSGKSYRLALRGEERGISYCSCPDYSTNTLGVCKHVLYALGRVTSKFSEKQLAKKPRRKNFSIHMRYDGGAALHVAPPDNVEDEALEVARPVLGQAVDDARQLVSIVGKLERLGQNVVLYPDAEEFIGQQLFQERMKDLVAEIRQAPDKHPLRHELLNAELLPYQLDGIAFAAGAGRAILADDMGLGKTIQGIGVAELLRREAGISKVLVICPASLKSQWRGEIQRFAEQTVQLVVGSADERAEQYHNDAFFTICNYEQVLRDILPIERGKWDLIILDEGQRIKNWESKTAGVVKSLRSPFALVLSGTPLENRIDELYSVVQFIDDRRLGPGFRFFNRHRIVDENGKVVGYKNLNELREALKPVLLRRTRAQVLEELPERTTDVVRIPPTEEQLELHNAHMRTVTMITRKPFLTEMDLLRLQKALLMCRMAADCTFLVDKEEPFYSSKLDHLDGLLARLADQPDRKCVLFSEWTRMLDKIEPLLRKHGMGFVRLDGSVPQKKRQELVNRFQNEPECRFFITTNAGSVGLNLQAANTVINVDLPWNPAVLEQRIARAHRMGQRNPVHVYVLVTEETLEENLLKTLSNKHDLALAALDVESDVVEVDFLSNIEEMKRRLEKLIGSPGDAPEDQSSRARAESEIAHVSTQRRERVAAAGGELLGAVFQFLGELTASDPSAAAPPAEVVRDLRERLGQCVEEDAQGRPRLSLTLPDRSALDGLAETMARLLVGGES